MSPFTPKPAGTVNIDVGAGSANVLVSATPGVRQIRVMNNGTATAWVELGKSGVTASATTGFPVPAGAIEVLTVKVDGPIYAAAIAAAATGKIYFTPGSGV